MINKDRLQMYVSLTKITIVLCWLSLFSFWAIKIFGGNWFEIMVENENFIKLSNTVQNTWLKYLVSFFTVFIANYLILCAIAQKFYFKGKTLAIVFAIITSVWIVSNFVPLTFGYLPFWYAYLVMILWGIRTQKGWKKCFGIFAIVFEFIFSTVSIITRNIPLHILDDYLMVAILIIDVNIMITLYYLYSNLIILKKGIKV
jgi:hypothetical protein